MRDLVDSNVFVRSVALSFERFRLDASSIYRRPDVVTRTQQAQATDLLTCDQQGLSVDFYDKGLMSAHSGDSSMTVLQGAITAGNNWLTHDEDALADVRVGHGQCLLDSLPAQRQHIFTTFSACRIY